MDHKPRSMDYKPEPMGYNARNDEIRIIPTKLPPNSAANSSAIARRAKHHSKRSLIFVSVTDVRNLNAVLIVNRVHRIEPFPKAARRHADFVRS